MLYNICDAEATPLNQPPRSVALITQRCLSVVSQRELRWAAWLLAFLWGSAPQRRPEQPLLELTASSKQQSSSSEEKNDEKVQQD